MQTIHLARVHIEAGDTVIVCCYFQHNLQIVQKLKDLGAAVELLGLNRSLNPIAFMAKLRRVFNSARPDIIHIQYMAPGLLPIIAARVGCRSRVVATVHQPATPYGKKARLLLRLAARFCDSFICVSEAVENSWFGTSRLFDPRSQEQRHFTIHNAVDIEKIDRILDSTNGRWLRTQYGIQGGPVIGAISRFRHEKGVDLLIKAFATLCKDLSTARLVLVGDGPDRPLLEQCSKDYGIADKVRWIGQQPWEGAMALMSIMDIVVIPSRWEGFGLIAIEAMAAKRAVIATSVDGLAEVIGNDGNGILVPPNDSGALALALLELVKQPQRCEQLRANARQWVETHFSMDVFRRRTLACFETLDPNRNNKRSVCEAAPLSH
jgi:L-malate glycosyltransferase